MSSEKKSVLRSSLAGYWYPKDVASLRAQLQSMLEGTDVESRGDVIGAILPHAGYQYSGLTAMKSLAGARRHYERIIVMGPSHRMSMHETCSLPGVTHYETPLGEVPLDRPFIEDLLAQPEFACLPDAHQGEHSVQIELPLLQHLFGSFQFVPIVVGQLCYSTSQRVADILRQRVDRDTLIVASSDFTHYGPRFEYLPFLDDVERNLRRLDLGAFACIEACDAAAFHRFREETGATICGRVPITILLSMLDSTHTCHLIEYTTSGALTGDFHNSVSYLSAQVRGQWPVHAGG